MKKCALILLKTFKEQNHNKDAKVTEKMCNNPINPSSLKVHFFQFNYTFALPQLPEQSVNVSQPWLQVHLLLSQLPFPLHSLSPSHEKTKK